MFRIEFGKVTNKVFYGLEDEKGKGLISEFKDGYIITILYKLYAMTTREGQVVTSLDLLLKECGYAINKDNRNNFKYILNKLKENNIIDFDGIDKSNTAFIISTEKMVDDNGFFIVETKELDLINKKAKDKREYNNLIKVYYYLKARCYKRGEGESELVIVGGRSQTTYVTYSNISYFANVTEAKIKEYIEILKELDLIVYKNLGKKYKPENPKYLTECANIYAFPIISNDVDNELKEGLKQQKYDYEKEGYIITNKPYKNNNRQVNGRKGYLVKKKNKGTITEEELDELRKIDEVICEL